MYYQPTYTTAVYATSPQLANSPRAGGSPTLTHQASFSYIPTEYAATQQSAGFGFDPSMFVHQVLTLSALGDYSDPGTPKKPAEEVAKKETVSPRKATVEALALVELRATEEVKPVLTEAVTNTHSPMASKAEPFLGVEHKSQVKTFFASCLGWKSKAAEKTPAQRF